MASTTDITSQAADAAQTLKSAAWDAAGAASEQVRNAATQAKSATATEISKVGEALRDAASHLNAGSAAERTLGQIANGFADASDSLRDKDLGQLIAAATDVAKRNPVAFIGGAILLGFAASRFLKASTPPMAEAYHPEADAPQPHSRAQDYRS